MVKCGVCRFCMDMCVDLQNMYACCFRTCQYMQTDCVYIGVYFVHVEHPTYIYATIRITRTFETNKNMNISYKHRMYNFKIIYILNRK